MAVEGKERVSSKKRERMKRKVYMEIVVERDEEVRGKRLILGGGE